MFVLWFHSSRFLMIPHTLIACDHFDDWYALRSHLNMSPMDRVYALSMRLTTTPCSPPKCHPNKCDCVRHHILEIIDENFIHYIIIVKFIYTVVWIFIFALLTSRKNLHNMMCPCAHNVRFFDDKDR